MYDLEGACKDWTAAMDLGVFKAKKYIEDLCRISIYMLLIIGVTYANAQVRNVLFDDDYFPNKKEELKIALKELKKGDKQFKKGNASYVSAIEPYLRAYQINLTTQF